MKPENGCKAKRYSDQMMCGKCGLVWDANDPEPPVCRSNNQLKVEDTPVNLSGGSGYEAFKSYRVSTGSI